MSRYFISKIIALIAGFSLLVIALVHNNNSIYTIDGKAYGTTWSISSTEYISDNHKEEIKLIIDRIDNIASNYKNDSEIALINKNYKKYQFISPDLFNILTIAKDVEDISEGYFNIMLGKISSNLGFSPTFGETLVQEKNSSYRLNEKNFSLQKSSSNWFDLSSIAKGYAVQKIHSYLIINNFNNHIIDIGGEIIINGSNYDNSWTIGIQNPVSIYNDAKVIINNSSNNFLAIATSGEYRNYKSDNNGNKVSHTINPDTLKSINNNTLSVTVVHETSATYADALATAFNVMGSDRAIRISNKYNIAIMIIINDLKPCQRLNRLLCYQEEIIYSDKWYDLNL